MRLTQDYPPALALGISGMPINDCVCGRHHWVHTAHREIECNGCRVTYRLPICRPQLSPCCREQCHPVTHYEAICEGCGKTHLRQPPKATAVLMGTASSLALRRRHDYGTAVEHHGADSVMAIYGEQP